MATVRSDGRPHLVPITFALTEAGIYTMIDHKPKKSPNLKRLDNIRSDPRVSLLADHYDENWDHLWWVRVDGTAAIVDPGPDYEAGTDLLVKKYRQYVDTPPAGHGILISIDDVRWWEWLR